MPHFDILLFDWIPLLIISIPIHYISSPKIVLPGVVLKSEKPTSYLQKDIENSETELDGEHFPLSLAILKHDKAT